MILEIILIEICIGAGVIAEGLLILKGFDALERFVVNLGKWDT
jgi:hypothetical protein